MEHRPNFMNEFNAKMENKRIEAIKRFLELSKNDRTPAERESRRRSLREILGSEDLDLNELKKIFKALNIQKDVTADVNPLDIAEAILPPISNINIRIIETPDTVVNPDEPKKPIEKGGENFEKAKLIPRTNIIIELLIENGIEPKNIFIFTGNNKPGMVRVESYNMIMLPGLKMMILVCDEERNATFIIDDYTESNPQQYYHLTKEQLKQHPKVSCLKWQDKENWKTKILDILTSPNNNKNRTKRRRGDNGNLKLPSGEKEEPRYLPYSKLVEEVRNAGINSWEGYRKAYREHTGWPPGPNMYYKKTGEWTSWYDFFGKEKPVYLSYAKLAEEAKMLGIDSFDKYQKEYPKHKGWPASPDVHYKKTGEWTSWYDFFGKEKPVFLPYNEFVKEVRAAGVNSHKKYVEEQGRHKNWPSRPDVAYEEWKSWSRLFGIEEILPYSQLAKEVQGAEVNSWKEYHKAYKEHAGWPSSPDKYYKKTGEWTSWYNFFGKEKPAAFLPYDKFAEEVRAAGIADLREYEEVCLENRPSGWPVNPEKTYKNKGWESWPKLFGREERFFVEFKRFSQEVREAGIKTVDKYRESCKDHKRWPPEPDIFYKRTGWISWNSLFNSEK